MKNKHKLYMNTTWITIIIIGLVAIVPLVLLNVHISTDIAWLYRLCTGLWFCSVLSGHFQDREKIKQTIADENIAQQLRDDGFKVASVKTEEESKEVITICMEEEEND